MPSIVKQARSLKCKKNKAGSIFLGSGFFYLEVLRSVKGCGVKNEQNRGCNDLVEWNLRASLKRSVSEVKDEARSNSN